MTPPISWLCHCETGLFVVMKETHIYEQDSRTQNLSLTRTRKISTSPTSMRWALHNFVAGFYFFFIFAHTHSSMDTEEVFSTPYPTTRTTKRLTTSTKPSMIEWTRDANNAVKKSSVKN